MVDVDALTDGELRTKLLEYGFPLMPITGTTRKVMAKKLKLLMESGKKSNDSSGRRSLAQFSSEEESDNDVKVVKKDKSRRATMAVSSPAMTMQPPKASNVRKSTRRNESFDSDTVEVSKVNDRKTTRTTKIIQMAEKEFDTGSDSEPEIVETDYRSPPRNNYETRESPIKSTVSSSSTFNYTKKYTPPKMVDSVSSRTSSSTLYSTHSPSRYPTYAPPTDASDKLNQIRSRLSLGATNNIDTSMYSSTIDTTADAGHTPFLSNFTKRLSSLSPNNKEFESKNEVIKEADSNGSGGIFNRNYMNRPRPREYTQNYQLQQNPENKSNYVSFLLIGSVALFFVILTALYMGMHSGGSALDTGLVVPYCTKQDRNAKKGVNCISDTDLQGAIDIYKVLKPELLKRAINNRCVDAKIKPFMTEDNIVAFISENYAMQDDFMIRQDLNNFMILLYKNKNWGVSILQTNDDRISDNNRIENLESVFINKDRKYLTAFVILEPPLPLKCSVYNKFLKAAQTIAICFGIGTLLWTSNYLYKHYHFYNQRKTEEVILMVEKIIDILQINASEETDQFLVVNHVRDMILPIEQRKEMEKTWLKALKFINENESRVRTEVQIVKGEQYEVWRWLGGLNTSSSAARNKSWQGQAFETQVGSPNSLPCSPTPCLKIRGMVEDGDRNLQTIREGVLGKCASQCRILHCAVDLSSKCVYLKCADQNEAAIAYRNLHGWWYASHLVTVKYLRLERYMQRYPESPQSGPPFLKAHQPTMDWSQ